MALGRPRGISCKSASRWRVYDVHLILRRPMISPSNVHDTVNKLSRLVKGHESSVTRLAPFLRFIKAIKAHAYVAI